MKIFLFILFFGISLSGFSRWGYGLKNYSLLYGKSYINGNGFVHSFEFQIDKKLRSCTRRTKYRGLGLSYTFGDNFQSFGIEGMYGPFWTLPVTRKLMFHPYLFLQVNMVRTNETFANDLNNINPGIGITGVWRIGRHINLRPQFQLGYRVNELFIENGKGFTADLKIGIGVNKLLFRKKENRYKN